MLESPFLTHKRPVTFCAQRMQYLELPLIEVKMRPVRTISREVVRKD